MEHRKTIIIWHDKSTLKFEIKNENRQQWVEKK